MPSFLQADTHAPTESDTQLLKRKRDITVDIPAGASADVVREHSLKKNVFMRARILVLVLVLVQALAIVGTYAYLTWTSNQTPSRGTVGETELRIAQNSVILDPTATETEVDGGASNNRVALASYSRANRADEVVRITFIPELEYLDTQSAVLGNAFLEEDWSAPVQEDGEWFIKTSYLKLHLKSDWQSNFIYSNGSFIYNKVLRSDEITPEILQGVTWCDSSVNRATFGVIRVNVIGDAIQAYPTDAPATWGVVVNSDTGDVTMSSG